jgi:hypothetical protein
VFQFYKIRSSRKCSLANFIRKIANVISMTPEMVATKKCSPKHLTDSDVSITECVSEIVLF